MKHMKLKYWAIAFTIMIIIFINGDSISLFGEKNIDNELPIEDQNNATDHSMTLDDIKNLAQKGDTLLFEDFNSYQGFNASSTIGHYIMVYSVDGGYRLVVGSTDGIQLQRVSLESIWEGGGIDIRYHDVDQFIIDHPSKPI